jgi:hypothetical protein
VPVVLLVELHLDLLVEQQAQQQQALLELELLALEQRREQQEASQPPYLDLLVEPLVGRRRVLERQQERQQHLDLVHP